MEEIVLVSDNHGQRKPLEYLKENYPVTDYFIPVFRVSHHGFLELSI